MTGPTHKQYSVCFAFITVIQLYKLNMLNINYYLALIIILSIAKSGALFPDVDHSWNNVSNKTIPNKIINTLIHLTGGKHRSWQTHSIDICIIFTVLSFKLPEILYNNMIITDIDKNFLSIIMISFASGWISHLFSDMMTSGGVRLFCFINKKIRFVPNRLFKLKFNTGHEWEAFNYKVIKILNIFLGLYCITYPVIRLYM